MRPEDVMLVLVWFCFVLNDCTDTLQHPSEFPFVLGSVGDRGPTHLESLGTPANVLSIDSES